LSSSLSDCACMGTAAYIIKRINRITYRMLQK